MCISAIEHYFSIPRYDIVDIYFILFTLHSMIACGKDVEVDDYINGWLYLCNSNELGD